MITVREIFSALYGAGRLARFEADGMAFFDLSARGFWRSFYAAVIVAPFYGILLVIRFSAAADVNIGWGRYFAVESISYVISWVIFPVVMASFAKIIERQEKYQQFVIAYNWAAVLQNAVYIPLAMLAASGAISGGNADIMGVFALIIILIYSWFVATTALELGAWAAIGIVALDLVLSIFIDALSGSMLVVPH